MKIIKEKPFYTSVVEVEHNGSAYRRSVTNTRIVEWKPISYDGDCNEGELEELFVNHLQELKKTYSDKAMHTWNILQNAYKLEVKRHDA